MSFPETKGLLEKLEELERRLDEATTQEEKRELCLQAQTALSSYSLATWRKAYTETLNRKEPE